MKQHNGNARNSNFEFLRIIVMLLCVALHLAVQSGILEGNSKNIIWAMLFRSAGGLIVDNLFVLISSYFLVNLKFSPKRILKVYFEVFTYTIPITFIMLIFFSNWVSLKDIVRGIFPYSGSPLWFATCYISMLLFTPFMNVLLEHRNMVKRILILLFFINVIPSTFLFRADFFYSGEAVWFCFLYLLMGYIRKYDVYKKINKVPNFVFLVVPVLIYILLLITYFSLDYLSLKFTQIEIICNTLSLKDYFIMHYNTLPAFVCSLCIFTYVVKKPPRTSNIINFVSQGTFAVYIIHQTPAFALFMWNEIFKVQWWMESIYYPLYFVMCVVLIFLVCCTIGIIRNKYIEPWIEKSKLFNYLLAKIETFYSVKDFDKYENKIE